MVRRRKISKTGVQQHKKKACDNKITASTTSDGRGSDQTIDNMTTPPMSKYQAAYELSQSVKNGHELVVEGLEWIVKKKEELLRQLRTNLITKQAFDEEWAEIGLLCQQIKAFSEQLEVSENRVKKVLKKDENKG